MQSNCISEAVFIVIVQVQEQYVSTAIDIKAYRDNKHSVHY